MTAPTPPFPHDLEKQSVILRRFIKKVADYSNDAWLARKADELIMLYGNPDAPKPQGLIDAEIQPSAVRKKEGRSRKYLTVDDVTGANG